MIKNRKKRHRIGRAINVFAIFFLLFAVPLMISIEQLVAYYVLVGLLTIFMIREMQDPLKTEKAFLKKWHVKRHRSNHINGLLFAGETFLMIVIPAVLIQWMVRGTQDFWLHLEILVSLWLLFLAISIGIGYLRISIYERRYEEMIARLEKEGEALPFLAEDPDEKERIIRNRHGENS